MGDVYEAFDTRLRRRVALKVLPGALADNPERRERVEREGDMLAALSPPNIVTIHSVETIDGTSVLVMELVEGRPLSEVIPPSGMTLDRILQVAIPLVNAVAAAHARGIMHRDIKPDNILVTAHGGVKVLDFGLAKLMRADTPSQLQATADTQFTVAGGILGTVHYMSPEQAEGKPIDQRSDLFSLGV